MGKLADLIEENGVRVAEHTCPGCGRKNDSAASVNSKAYPSDGDFTVCLCGTVMRFVEGAAGLGVRALTADDEEDMYPALAEQIARVKAAIAAHAEADEQHAKWWRN